MNVQEIYKAVSAAFWEGDLVLSRVGGLFGGNFQPLFFVIQSQ